MMCAIEKAREVLTNGGDLVDLAEAIGTIISDPSSSLEDIRLGLRHGGIIAEQAAVALRRREGVSTPPPSDATILSAQEFRSHLGP